MRRAYLIGLGLIALLSVGSFLVVDDMVSAQEHSGAVINVAGRQRMLSQRLTRHAQAVASLSNDLALSPDLDPARSTKLGEERRLLGAAISEMRAAHAGLTRGDAERGLPGIASERERALYESLPYQVSDRVKWHLADADRILARPTGPAARAAVERMTRAADEPLLAGLHAVVRYHEGEAREHTALMRQVHLVILGITLAALLIEALVIFRPLVRHLQRTERSLAGRKKELWHQSRHDHLTGLPNRLALREAVESGVPGRSEGGAAASTRAAGGGGPAASERQATRDRTNRHAPHGPMAGPYAILAIDLDNFKRLNDTVGHEAGDDLLRAVGHALARELRDGDLAVRMGGDEFVVIVPLDDSPTIPASDGPARPDIARVPGIVAERLCGAIRRVIAADPRASFVSASIGVAVSPDNGAGFDLAFANADIALYQAKATGRDRWARFEPAMREAHEARDVAETMLHDGLARDAFEPHFQPQVNLRTGETVAVEALARLIGRDGNPVPPGAFLPAAEATGLIVPLGRRVIERAIEAAAEWERKGVVFGRLSVNASAAQLRDPDFAPFLVRALETFGLPAFRLAVEVLETVVLDRDGAGIIATCQAIREAGIAVELDDFGTGYASIANVEALGVERIKIDRSILAAAPSARRDVLRAIVTLAGGLGVDVMAEGVETAEDGARLLALGCVEAQGYHLARPMPGASMGAWLAERRSGGTAPDEAARSAAA